MHKFHDQIGEIQLSRVNVILSVHFQLLNIDLESRI